MIRFITIRDYSDPTARAALESCQGGAGGTRPRTRPGPPAEGIRGSTPAPRGPNPNTVHSYLTNIDRYLTSIVKYFERGTQHIDKT